MSDKNISRIVYKHYKMYFFETKRFLELEEDTTLVISNDKPVIQELYHEDTVLCETVIEYFHMDGSEEIAVVLSEKILKLFKLYKIFSIDSTKVFFGDITLEYQKGEIQTLESTEPMKLSCIVNIDESLLVEDDCTTCKINIDDNLNLEFDNKITFHKKTFKTFHASHKQKFNFDLLSPILNDHKGQMCKIYMDDDRPLCLEFLRDTVTRYHVAPMYEN